jgi:hypothetical protein
MPADFWLAESFLPSSLRPAAAALRSAAFWGVVGAALIALGWRLSRASRTRGEAFDLLAVAASWPPLLEIVVHHYWGSFRHHLFLGTPLLLLVLGWALDRRGRAPALVVSRWAALALLSPWVAFQVLLGAGSFVLDYRLPFSDTKAAAGVLPLGAHVVVEDDWRCAGVMFWRPDVDMRARAWGGHPFRYIRADARWEELAKVPPLVEEECRAAPDRVFFAGFEPSLGGHAGCARRVEYPRSPYWDQPLTFEKFDLFAVDCACVERP